MDVELGDRSSVEVALGDRVTLRLAQPVTGHEWDVAVEGRLIVLDDILEPAATGAPGATAQRVVTVGVNGPGTAVAQLKRGWETGFLERREIEVLVDGAPW
ncbi:hypothetical protein [Kineococcus sp. SYSU DK003]|uniref:hypothetical protein n=1 Tax=Kineococcus sp. SYSU DK003 TaxID=3383124 RepID=UPI003D7C635D